MLDNEWRACAVQGYLMQMLAVKLGVATGLNLAQQCRCLLLFSLSLCFGLSIFACFTVSSPGACLRSCAIQLQMNFLSLYLQEGVPRLPALHSLDNDGDCHHRFRHPGGAHPTPALHFSFSYRHDFGSTCAVLLLVVLALLISEVPVSLHASSPGHCPRIGPPS